MVIFMHNSSMKRHLSRKRAFDGQTFFLGPCFTYNIKLAGHLIGLNV